MEEKFVDIGSKCSCCMNIVVTRGINDIATTDSWAIKYFLNQDDVYKYHSGSSFKVDMICPICKTVYHDVTIRNFFTNIHHLNCPCTNTYAHYPERFLFNFLKQAKINSVNT